MKIARTILMLAILSIMAHVADSRSAVEHVLLTQQDAWNRHDLDAFMSGYWNSPDLTPRCYWVESSIIACMEMPS